MGSMEKRRRLEGCLYAEPASAHAQPQQQAALAQLRRIIMELPNAGPACACGLGGAGSPAGAAAWSAASHWPARSGLHFCGCADLRGVFASTVEYCLFESAVLASCRHVSPACSLTQLMLPCGAGHAQHPAEPQRHYKGVTFNPRDGRWLASVYLRDEGKHLELGWRAPLNLSPLALCSSLFNIASLG